MPASASELEDYFRDTKDSQQELLKAISARLSKEVVANYQAFIDGMRQIGEIDLDVSRASIHVTNSLRKLSSARESLVSGTLGITYQRRRRERMADVASRLRWLRSLFRVDEEVQVWRRAFYCLLPVGRDAHAPFLCSVLARSTSTPRPSHSSWTLAQSCVTRRPAPTTF